VAIKIYHNPRCTKSRQTLQLLEENGVSPEVIEYLKTPPTEDELKTIADSLNRPVREMMRTKEDIYKEKNLKEEQDEDNLISAIAQNPILLERPIVVNGEKAAIGRPPEDVLKIL